MEQLTPQLIDRLVALGRRPDRDAPRVLEEFGDLRAQDWINRLTPYAWQAALADSPTEDVVAVAKAVSTIEVGWRWCGGSVVAIIWISRFLRKRDARVADELDEWLASRNNNPWLDKV